MTRDLADLYKEIAAGRSDAALKWHWGLKDAILSLERQPHRFPVTPEKRQLRHLLYGRKPHIYRVIYGIVEKQQRIEVLRIRHGARRKLRSSDIS